MKYWSILLVIIVYGNYCFCQDEKIQVNLNNLRSLRDYVLSKQDSLLLKEIDNYIVSGQFDKLQNIPNVLNACSTPKKAKVKIIDILINRSDYLDTTLFKIYGEILFLTLPRYPVKNAKTRFIVLDQIMQKKNVHEFGMYIISNDLLNRCDIYRETCSNPRNEVDNATQSDVFLSNLATLFNNNLKLLEKICYEAENFCIRYNYLRMIDFISAKK